LYRGKPFVLLRIVEILMREEMKKNFDYSSRGMERNKRRAVAKATGGVLT
jgi:hypothetical protein